MGVARRDVTEAVRPSSLYGRASLSSQVAFNAMEQRKVTVKVRGDRTERVLCVWSTQTQRAGSWEALAKEFEKQWSPVVEGCSFNGH